MKKIKELIFASHNKGKIIEIQQILAPFSITLKTALDMNLPDVEENGKTFTENALLKARTIANKTGFPCLADDSGLCVEALNGAPGVFSARYAPNRDFKQGMTKLLSEISASTNKSRRAYFCCVLSLAYPCGQYELFEGKVDGSIAQKPMGEGGFGYDPLFIPDGYEQSFAQLGAEVKNKISHRARALQKFLTYLQES